MTETHVLLKCDIVSAEDEEEDLDAGLWETSSGGSILLNEPNPLHYIYIFFNIKWLMWHIYAVK
jgi:hypothetical protein